MANIVSAPGLVYLILALPSVIRRDHRSLQPSMRANAPSSVDLRSDTITRPGAAMRAVMVDAVVGDDGFDDDPTVHELQRRTAALLGKEAALFVPSGTMANQIAIRLQSQPGDEIVAHRLAHICGHEAGAPAALSGVTLTHYDSPTGAPEPGQLLGLLRVGEDGLLSPTALVCFENTHNACGGVVLNADRVAMCAAQVRAKDIALHLDGARICNAAVASNVPPALLAAPFDTVSLCLSKGLGAPAGSLLAGPADLIARARRLRRMLGGMMRQVGILAAAGLYALDHHLERLHHDHLRAAILAESLAALPGVLIAPPQTNIVAFDLAPDHPALARCGQHKGVEAALEEAGVRITARTAGFRAVLHLDVDDDELGRAVQAFEKVLSP